MTSIVRGRYAPSPTGELHLGNARTALVAWLAARAAGGAFVMRVEDLDPPRTIPGAEARLLDDLRWLGLDWDEGPEAGGPHAPYHQRLRTTAYEAAVERLAAAGRLYACTCSRADLRRLASAPHGRQDEGPVYPGMCRERGLPWSLRPAAQPGGRSPALRFQVEAGPTRFDDMVAGPFEQDVAADVGDFVVRRADGLWAYQLAVVVDDMAMGVTQVVRGADLLDSTPRQLQLIDALGGAPPSYAHVPLVLDASGQRLAKRDGATAIRTLRDRGLSSERLIGLMAHSLGLAPWPTPVTAHELVGRFAWERVSREPWRLTPGLLAP
jgi:glutamyl-tRNA synthetase